MNVKEILESKNIRRDLLKEESEERKVLAVYDTSEAVDSYIQSIKDDWDYWSEEWEMEGSFEDNEDTIRDRAYSDDFIYDDHYEIFINDLNELIKEKGQGMYKIKGINLGWRNREGDATKEINSASDFMELMPDTDLTIYVYADANNPSGFMAKVYHHDSPTGEYYYFTPTEEEEEE